MTDKVVAIIQARMGSSRLPGKVLMNICGKSVLHHIIDRVKQANLVDDIIIATTVLEQDQLIVDEADRCGVKVFRGSEENVLSRYYHAAKETGATTVIRITSDCPLIDPVIIDKMIGLYISNGYNLMSNAGPDSSLRTFPRGLDAEVFSFLMLEEAYMKANKSYQLEHVTPYLYENIDKIGYFIGEEDYSLYRWTLDTEEDYHLIKQIYENLYHGCHDFFLDKIITLMKQKPELHYINAHVEQKKLPT
ncbi:MAG: glycosyltransferase family protein [Desulfitobacterium hafniense]|nr:glycosyltransferase family protein [Desulfitobacterium hafniense]